MSVFTAMNKAKVRGERSISTNLVAAPHIRRYDIHSCTTEPTTDHGEKLKVNIPVVDRAASMNEVTIENRTNVETSREVGTLFSYPKS
jgi:hypothetical protein